MDKEKTRGPMTGDEKIIDMYWDRNPDAIQETNQKYGPMLRNIAYNVLADIQDCEECQNDAYLRIWNSIPSTRPTVFPAFIAQIMRRVAFSRYKEKSRKKRIPSQLIISLEELDHSISNGRLLEEAYEAKEFGELINSYIESLDDDHKYLFMDRYYLAEPVEKTASDLSIPVRVAYRELRKIRQGLREYLERNGVRL